MTTVELPKVNAPRVAMRSLVFSRPLVMGILNVTPDSFSDAGLWLAKESALAQAKRMIAEGADIIDIGGESTRPGAAPVALEEELSRVIPVVAALRSESDAIISNIVISVDTYKSEVARQALDCGADMINDISAGRFDSAMMPLVAERGAWYCAMHMQGTPATMQDAPHYSDVVREVCEFLDERVRACVAAGISRARIIIDPGIGFGKRLEDNLTLLKHLSDLTELGCPILVGASRKRFVSQICGRDQTDNRLAGSISAALWAVGQGANIVRVHDVAETKQALAVYRALADTRLTDTKATVTATGDSR